MHKYSAKNNVMQQVKAQKKGMRLLQTAPLKRENMKKLSVCLLGTSGAYPSFMVGFYHPFVFKL